MNQRQPLPPDLLLNMADRDLRSARLLLADSDPNGAANRVYYAMFHAVSAVFAARGRALATHKGLIGQFSLHFVQAGLLPKELGRALNVAQELRCDADYTLVPLQREDIEPSLDDAETLIAAIKTFLATPDRDHPSRS